MPTVAVRRLERRFPRAQVAEILQKVRQHDERQRRHQPHLQLPRHQHNRTTKQQRAVEITVGHDREQRQQIQTHQRDGGRRRVRHVPQQTHGTHEPQRRRHKVQKHIGGVAVVLHKRVAQPQVIFAQRRRGIVEMKRALMMMDAAVGAPRNAKRGVGGGGAVAHGHGWARSNRRVASPYPSTVPSESVDRNDRIRGN